MLAADYPFLDVLWTIIIFFLWVLWFWLLFTVFADIFRRSDLSGWGKAGWLIFTIVLPYLGVFVYLISQHEGMTQRNVERARTERAQFDQYVREAAGGGGSAAEIERAKNLLDSGAITQAEFDAIKQKALA
jgi:Short C-terminal domain/Phospholipase_D-nuclease N-terminal